MKTQNNMPFKWGKIKANLDHAKLSVYNEGSTDISIKVNDTFRNMAANFARCPVFIMQYTNICYQLKTRFWVPFNLLVPSKVTLLCRIGASPQEIHVPPHLRHAFTMKRVQGKVNSQACPRNSCS